MFSLMPKRGKKNVKNKSKLLEHPVGPPTTPETEETIAENVAPVLEVDNLELPTNVSDESIDSADGELNPVSSSDRPSRPPMTTEEKFEFYDTFTEQDLKDLSPVFPLRGFCSEVCLPTALEERIPGLTPGPLLQKRCQSMENLILSGDRSDSAGNKNYGGGRQYLEISNEMLEDWHELFNETQQNRFSFFDKLFAMGYIVDSLEVPSHPENLEYLVEAESSDYQDKVGYGRVVFKTKHVYTGNFKDWYFDGPGHYKWINGSTYHGDFKNGVMHGEGVLEWEDGSIYEGQFLNGVRAGWGVYSTAMGFTYAGDWLHGLPHGKGKMWYDPQIDDGDYYEGQWYAGKAHGTGLRQYSNGDRYVGDWDVGIRMGIGTMTWLAERQVYKGDWSNGIPHGKGRHTWYLPRTEGSNFPARHVYDGDFSDGLRHGIGRMVYSCGSVYEGRWMDGNRYGKGIFINPAGDKFIGLFQHGSIMFGPEVTLHKPSYQCDFGPLVKILQKQFGIQTVEESLEIEHTKLSETTMKFLDQIRELYKKAGYLGQTWGAYGVFPEWLKQSNKSQTPKIKLQDGKRRIVKDYGNEDGCGNPCCIDKEMKLTKKSPDNVHPVTRFGLWLLFRDCPEIITDITTAEIDNRLNSIGSLSFQTPYNPFEPITFWQFLQCLVSLAGILYVDIPAKSDILRPESPAFDDDDVPIGDYDDVVEPEYENEDAQFIAPSASRLGMAPSASGLKIVTPSASGVKIATASASGLGIAAASASKLGIGAASASKLGIGAASASKLGIGAASASKLGIGAASASKLGIGAASASKLGIVTASASGLEMVGQISKEITGLLRPPSTAEKKDLDYLKSMMGVGEAEEQHGEHPNAGSCLSLASSPIGDIPVTPVASLSEAFEKMLLEKFIPYLHTEPGMNLPPIPNPLPSLTDLYNSFRKIHKGREVITGIEFLESVLPKKFRPEYQDAVYWHRSKQVLSPFSNLSVIVRNSFANTPGTTLPTATGTARASAISVDNEFIGDKSSLENLFASGSLHLKPKQQKRPSIEIYGRGNKVFGFDPSDSEENTEEEFQENPIGPDDDLLQSTIFSDRDLVEEPFLWDEEPKCTSIKRNERAFQYLKTQDVIQVLRCLYPKVCGESRDTDLDFQMNFSDWMFGTSMIAKICADREFYSIMKKESESEHRPRTRGVASTPRSKPHDDLDPCGKIKGTNSYEPKSNSASAKSPKPGKTFY